MVKYSSSLCLALSLLMVSCEADYDSPENNYFGNDVDVVNTLIYEHMQDIYLWYTELPEVNPTSYDSPYTLMEALKSDRDNWSFVMDKPTFEQHYNDAVSAAHGFLVGTNTNNELFIIAVYPNTPASKAGIKRGYKIISINNTTVNSSNYSDLIGNNQPGVVNTIKFETPSKDIIETTISKELIDINPVLYSDVINITENDKAGYFVFQEFIDTASFYLDTIFKTFKDENINHLIVDLRYNGGGVTTVAELLSNYIAGSKQDGNLMYYTLFNNKNEWRNSEYYFQQQENSLNLEDVYFITTEYTASASELLINNLYPFIPVTLIGTRTYGKPVGMSVSEFRDFNYVVVPVSFESLNSKNEGRYYNGLQADYEVSDNTLYDFGDLNEPCLNAAYQLIANGKYEASTYKSSKGGIDKILNVNPNFQNAITTIDQ